MKKNLGKLLLLFFILLSVETLASTYKWSAAANKTKAVANEAIYLKYICEFSDAGELYSIDFNPATQTKEYSIKLLSESRTSVEGKRVDVYEFVAFVHKPAKIVFDFEISMNKTTQESINVTTLGRDNAQKRVYSTQVIRQKTLMVEVDEAPSELVGKFTLDVKKDAPAVKAFEPYHVEILIAGVGNFEAIKPFEFSMQGVKVFSQKSVTKIALTKEGISGLWSQKLAFVSDHNFTLEKISLNYFDLEKHASKELSHEATQVSVEKGFLKEELLEVKEKNFTFSYSYLYYVLTFAAGFLLGKIKIKKRLAPQAKGERFLEKIKQAKSLEELVMVLVIEDSTKYKELIEQIESKNVTSLGHVRKLFNI